MPLSLATLAEFRQLSTLIDHTQHFPNSVDPVCHRIDSAGQVLEIYEFKPSHTPDTDAALLWLHGGGYISGHGQDLWFGALFAERAGVRVFSVHYRLAPEFPFPAARDDAWNALKWLAAESDSLGVNPARISLGGASAGAGLTAGLAIYNRDQSGPAVAFQLLLYPMLDHQHDTPSGRLSVPFWTRSNSLAAWDMYLNSKPPEASSVPATTTDLTDLPPTFLTVGEADIFLDEVCVFAKQLSQSGVQSTLLTYPGVFHAAERQGYATPIGRQMVNDYVNALVNALGTKPAQALT